ncbi:MAG: RND transporter [Spirochaetales bacterium]|nr:RND transporter [Spirochaetales bacterium]
MEAFKRPLLYLVLGGLMAALPLGEEPHLLGKLKLLRTGHLYGFMDWFDLALHGLPLTAALLYLLISLLQYRKVS